MESAPLFVDSEGFPGPGAGLLRMPEVYLAELTRKKPGPAKPSMSKRESARFTLLRSEVVRLVGRIPAGRFTTYGSIARNLGVNPRQVAFVLARLDEVEAANLPWHRVVAAEGRISRGMEEELRAEQRQRLIGEGIGIDARGFIVDPDRHFHAVVLPKLNPFEASM